MSKDQDHFGFSVNDPLRKLYCAQVVLQTSLIKVFISVSLEQFVTKYVNRFELYLVYYYYT